MFRSMGGDRSKTRRPHARGIAGEELPMSKQAGRVLVSQPVANANVREALTSLHERDLLAEFCTTVAWARDSVWNRFLPDAIVRQFHRRMYPIPKKLIHST